MVLAKEKIKEDERLYNEERKVLNSMKSNSKEDDQVTSSYHIQKNNDSAALKKFKHHMRNSYRFLPKKILQQLYGGDDGDEEDCDSNKNPIAIKPSILLQ